jgi:hypothetical protein
MYRFPYLLNVYSNGNAQTAFPGGFNTSTKNSKNALHVAANDPNDVISSYSSFGPTIDGRLVPQIAAVGTNVYSLDYNNSYQVLSGTSMATPGTSGTLALLYERYKNIYGVKPLASLMKALVTNTAKDVGNPGPDYKYGFGNLNGLRAVKVLDNKMFYTASIANGATYEKDIIVPAGLVTLKVMLAYTDKATTPGATNILINNLDIKIIKDGVEILPWVLNPLQPNANATRGIDNLNNIEQVTIDNPVAGSYKIVVTGASIPLDTQEFSVIYDYVAPELRLTYPIGTEKFNPSTTEYIRWDYEGEAKTFNVEYSSDGGFNYTIIAKDVPSAARNFAWKVPQGVAQNAKIRVSAGSKVDVSKENFTIMAEPKNLVIAPAICGVSSYKMDWDPIVGAKYEVLKLNGNQFDSVTTVTDPTYTFDNLTAGENNWFTVRAIDIVTNAVSERARAINVEPISKPVLTALNLPFIENFNERKATNYTLSKASTAGSIGYESLNQISLDAVKISGNGVAAPTTWVASTATNAFANNPNYIKRVTFCDIDASSLTAKIIRVKFNLIWNSVALNKSFFRVLVNGTPISSYENVLTYSGTTLTGNTTVTYDLTAFAGTTFNLSLEAVIDNDVLNPTTTPVYNVLRIDNVEIYEATTIDLALTAFTASTGFTANETVTAKVYNYSPVAVSNIPVSYTINGGTEVTEVIPGPINPLSDAIYNFTQKADYSVLGLYTVVGKVNYFGDTVVDNNSITKTVANIGTDILIGSAASITTCSATFTDSGTRYAEYANNLNQTITFVPMTAGNSVKVDFTTFSVEADYDYLYVYDGATITSPLLGKYTGSTLPPSQTATTSGGQLTFRFTSDAGVTDIGWIANLFCVPTPIINDAGILSIITPEVLGKKTSINNITIKVNNLSSAIATNVPVFYQVEGGAKVTDVVPTINPFANIDFTFATKADLSTANRTYTITSGIDQVDANLTNNSISKVVYNKNDLPNNINTNGFAISKLKWNDVVNVSGTTGYSDFKTIKIPVYAGFTYQPEVTIVKPERPINNNLTTTPGVFTMMVIDLNGDGNLTDEFYAGNFWVNTVNTPSTAAPIPIASTTTIHYFRNSFSLAGGLTIPGTTTSGEKLMRVIHMFRSPNEFYNVNLGPTLDGLTTSRQDFEIEEYTINVLPFTAADASVESIVSPLKPGNKPVVISAVVRNYSNAPITNFPIAYKINGGIEVVENVTATIAAAATTTFTFATKADLSLPADYTIEVYTKLLGDTDATNDSKLTTLSKVGTFATNVTGTFDGVDDYIVSDVTPALGLTNNYTFEAWINQKSPTVFGRILDKSRVLLFVHNNAALTLYKENSLVLSITTAGASYAINTEQNSIQQNKWHHVAFTVSSTNVYTIYIDGIVAPYTTPSGVAAPAIANTTSPIFIGNNAGLARGFNGNIDEVRIWSGVRDQATIANNTTTKYVGNESGLLAYYSFAEGDKQFVYDASANDNGATVVNANTNGLGEGKFWNTPVLLKDLIQFTSQQLSSYDPTTKTYTVLLNDGADITTVAANFTLEMNSIAKINGLTQVSGVTTNDYTNPVSFIVEGVGFNTGISETYTINVTRLSNESKLLTYNFDTTDNPSLTQPINTTIAGSNATANVAYGINVSNLKANFTVSPGAELFIDQVKQDNQKTIQLDYSLNRIVSVVSENKLSKTNYMIAVNAKNTEANFISYSVTNQVGTSLIDPIARTINVFVNNNANLNALLPTFQVSDKATTRIGTYLQNSGVTTLNYTLPVNYNIESQNGNILNWTVTIERAKPTITLLGDAIVSLPKGCIYTEAGFSAKDNLNNDINLSVMISGMIDVNVIGQYILTYTATDALSNQASISRTVNVTSDACTLGLSSNTIDGFSIYPNPVNQGKVFVVAKVKGLKNIKIFDLLGKQIFSQQTLDGELNISKLQRGIYVIKITQEGKTSVQKLIIE